jgi:polar amino acid transport system substrate-binding protein
MRLVGVSLLVTVLVGCVSGLLPAGTASAERLVVGIDQAFPPHQFVDDQGIPAGFDLEIFEAVARSEGIDFEVRAAPWFEVRRQLEEGEIDAVPGMVWSPVRDEKLEFSAPIFLAGYAAFVRAESDVHQLSDLEGRVVAVERGDIWEDRILERHYPVELDSAPTPLVALQHLAGGRADAAILLRNQGLFLARQLSGHGIRTLGTTDTSMGLGETVAIRVAVPRGSRNLLARLNDGLTAIRASGQHDAIYERWFGVLREVPFWERRAVRLLVAGAAAAAFGLLASMLWSRMLARRVAERTRSLAEAEEEKRSLQAQLLQAQKMDALGRLAAGVAHDFNNVLTVIMGGLELGKASIPPGDRAERVLTAANTAARSARDLIAQLLTFSRAGDVKPTRMNWNDLLDENEAMLERLLGSRAKFRVDRAPELPDVMLDRSQALQVVLNLAVNARDAMAASGGGTVWIETSRVEGSEPTQVRLSVSDTGRGMDAETRERIFEPFYTTRPGEGSGLGLSTVYGIVTRSGGTLHVMSEVGKGSRFDVDLPAGARP